MKEMKGQDNKTRIKMADQKKPAVIVNVLVIIYWRLILPRSLFVPSIASTAGNTILFSLVIMTTFHTPGVTETLKLPFSAVAVTESLPDINKIFFTFLPGNTCPLIDEFLMNLMV
jgi:hypothetical protein